MKDLSLDQAQKLIQDIVEKSLNNFNAKYPENKITHDDSYKYGYIVVEFALLLCKHNTIESFINNNIDCLPMDISKDE